MFAGAVPKFVEISCFRLEDNMCSSTNIPRCWPNKDKDMEKFYDFVVAAMTELHEHIAEDVYTVLVETFPNQPEEVIVRSARRIISYNTTALFGNF